jgi:hypothetical protein
MIDPAAFWLFDRERNVPLTDDLLEHAERVLGVKLPASYVRLLRAHNGGYTRGFVIPTVQPTTWADDHVTISELFGISAAPPPVGAHNILDSAYMTDEWELPPKQVLLAGDGHYWITLDYRRGEVPAVTWLDVEAGEDVQLAATFDEFLAQLLPSTAVDEDTGALRPR